MGGPGSPPDRWVRAARAALSGGHRLCHSCDPTHPMTGHNTCSNFGTSSRKKQDLVMAFLTDANQKRAREQAMVADGHSFRRVNQRPLDTVWRATDSARWRA